MKKHVKGYVVIVMMLFSLFAMSACSDSSQSATETTVGTEVSLSVGQTGYEQITPQQAKLLMDTEESYVIIDARTEEEFAEGHIEGAVLIPEYEILQRAEKELPQKDQLILVYCRSGRRSKIASEVLVSLGYTNVKEFGGIIDWPYDVVK